MDLTRRSRDHGDALMQSAQKDCGVDVDCRHGLCRRRCQAFLRELDAGQASTNQKTRAFLGCVAQCARPSAAGP